MNRKLAIFLAASLGDLFTYCVTKPEALAMAYPAAEGGGAASAVRFWRFRAYAVPLAAIEGIFDRSGGDGGLEAVPGPSCGRSALKEGLQ